MGEGFLAGVAVKTTDKGKKKKEKKFVIYGAEKNQTPLVPPPKRNAMRWLSKKKKEIAGGEVFEKHMVSQIINHPKQ